MTTNVAQILENSSTVQKSTITLVSGRQVKVWAEQVTIEIANRLLNRQHDNQRNSKSRRVLTYARQMSEDKWFPTVDPIQISDSKSGKKLVNGQHRLMAAIEAIRNSNGKLPFVEMVLFSGVDPVSITAFDDGAKRSIADVLQITGNTEWGCRLSSIGSALNAMMQFKYGCDRDIALASVRGSYSPSQTEVTNFAESVPHFRESIKKFHTLYKYNKVEKVISLSSAIPLFYFFDAINATACHSIFRTIESRGVPFDGKGEMSPSYHLYHWIMDQKDKNVTLRHADYLTAFIWAFEKTINDVESDAYKHDVTGFTFGKNHIGADQIRSLFKSMKM